MIPTFELKIVKTNISSPTRKLFDGPEYRVIYTNPNGRKIVRSSRSGYRPSAKLVPQCKDKTKTSIRYIRWRIQFHPAKFYFSESLEKMLYENAASV